MSTCAPRYDIVNCKTIPPPSLWQVFTPLEYGCCGLPEEEAIAQFGEESVEVRVVNEISWMLQYSKKGTY